MTNKNHYTQQEWRLLVFAPQYAANGVAAIDGNITPAESLVITNAMLAAKSRYPDNELIACTIDGLPELMEAADIPVELMQAKTVEDAERVFFMISKILEKKSPPDEAHQYSQFLVDLIKEVSGASGKILKMFGDTVSEEESDFIERISRMLYL
jgi:hypothetical protein